MYSQPRKLPHKVFLTKFLSSSKICDEILKANLNQATKSIDSSLSLVPCALIFGEDCEKTNNSDTKKFFSFFCPLTQAKTFSFYLKEKLYKNQQKSLQEDSQIKKNGKNI